MTEEKTDFLAIGDITTDAFIRIRDASVSCDAKKENCKLCFSYGQKVPYESVEVVPAVGNSANAAVCAARLGLKSALITNMGDDKNGKECLESLNMANVDTEFVKIHSGKETNYHYVLWYGDERTILVKHHKYNYEFPDNMTNPRWVYLSSLAENSIEYHGQILNWLKKNPQIKLAFQPGTFQIKMGYQNLSEIYKRSDIFFCNKEEAQRILETDEKNTPELAKKISILGPKMVVVTDGAKGAYLFDGTDVLFQPIYPEEKPPVNRTGAGDAFAATFTSALAMGKTPEEALVWSPINSVSVIHYVGAQKGLLTMPQILDYLAKAPCDYKPRKIESQVEVEANM